MFAPTRRIGGWLLILLVTCAPAARAYLLWEARRDHQIIHILAHVPLQSPDIADTLPPRIEQVFDQSTLIIFESDMDDERRADRLRALIAAGHYPDGENILKHLPRRVMLEYGSFNREMGIESEEAYQLRPWLAAQQVLHVAALKSGIRPKENLENYFFARAERDEKAVQFLASDRDTLNLYSNMGAELQVQMLQKAMKDARNISNILTHIQSAWERGDPDRATASIQRSFSGFESLQMYLFNARNERWAQRIVEHSPNDGFTFVLIGLSHLVGPDNVLDRLRGKGFEIRQITP